MLTEPLSGQLKIDQLNQINAAKQAKENTRLKKIKIKKLKNNSSTGNRTPVSRDLPVLTSGKCATVSLIVQ